MIVPMKKATLLVSAKEQQTAIKKLRGLGALHVTHIQPPQSENLDALKGELVRAERALVILEKAAPSEKSPLTGGEAAVRDLLQKVSEKDTLSSHLHEKRETRKWFDAWGEVSLESLESLEKAGITLRCYRTDKTVLKNAPEGLDIHILGEEKGAIYAVLFARSPEEKLDQKEEVMPRVDVHELDRDIASIQNRITAIESDIAGFGDKKQAIGKHAASLKKEIAYHSVLAGMGASDEIVYLQGFLPEERIAEVKSVSDAEDWGYIFEEPDDPAEVPTLLKNSRVPRIIEPLFQFMGTLPGYHETDVSLVFLLSFSLFYAMIIGDAGYGLIFLGITAFIRSKHRKAPFEPFALFYVLSAATIIWGTITGTWFGSRAIIEWPPLRRLVIEPIFSFNESDDAALFMMRFSFILGLIHLMIAHFMAFLKKLPSIKAVAQLGWVLICAGMFFVVDFLVLSHSIPKLANMFLLTGIGVVGVFTNFSKNPLKLIGGFFGAIAGSIQNVIGAFSDIISYIRLFAVGLAGVTVAATFNDMAGGIFAPVVLVLGHGLNIVLGMMSVMVHGVRLNMLEFSGHLGQEWSGTPYEPFKE